MLYNLRFFQHCDVWKCHVYYDYHCYVFEPQEEYFVHMHSSYFWNTNEYKHAQTCYFLQLKWNENYFDLKSLFVLLVKYFWIKIMNEVWMRFSLSFMETKMARSTTS